MKKYRIEVTNDEGWWLIRIPEIDGLTQARSISEVDYMARDYITLVTGTPVDEIALIHG